MLKVLRCALTQHQVFTCTPPFVHLEHCDKTSGDLRGQALWNERSVRRYR